MWNFIVEVHNKIHTTKGKTTSDMRSCAFSNNGVWRRDTCWRERERERAKQLWRVAGNHHGEVMTVLF